MTRQAPSPGSRRSLRRRAATSGLETDLEIGELQLLAPGDAAALLGVDADALRVARRQGLLVGVMVRGAYHYSVDELERFHAARVVKP